MDCGSGLLLMRTIRRLDAGQLLVVHTEEPSVPSDLDEWARLAGHEVIACTGEDPTGPWQVTVRRGEPTTLTPTGPSPTFSTGPATLIGHRLWLYSNFHCNLACHYCCAKSSPQAPARLLPVSLALAAAEELCTLGGRELLVTGGEPFLRPDIGAMVTQLAARLPVTLLTNAMLFDRGARLQALESMPRDRVTLQVSVDSAGPALHDRHRGRGSHARALAGIARARRLGFSVKVAATLYDDEADQAAELNAYFDGLGIDYSSRLVRPVAQQGFANSGHRVSIDTLQPEPTLTADGIWWHPVAVTDPAMQVTTSPLPLAAALDTIRDTLVVQDGARREGRRHVFRCA